MTGARKDKQPLLLSREVIKELLMSLEMLVWKRFSTRPGLGSGSSIARPALWGGSRLFLPLEEPATLHAERLNQPQRRRQPPRVNEAR